MENNNLNKKYFETKSIHKKNVKKKSFRTYMYFIISSIIFLFLINYFITDNKREVKIKEIQSYKFEENDKDTVYSLSDFKILLPQNFVKTVDDSGFLFFAKKNDNKDYIFFVHTKKIYDNDLIKSYKTSLKNASNNYNISIRINEKDVSELDLIINQTSKGMIKLLKKDDETMLILHVSSPIKDWNENLSGKIINSFEIAK